MQGNWIQCFQSLTNVKRSEDIKETLKKDAPKWNSVLGVGKSETVLINDRYKEALDELKRRYGVGR